MNIKNYINENFKGNISEYARSIGKKRQQVDKWLKRDCKVIDGQVYCKVSERVEVINKIIEKELQA